MTSAGRRWWLIVAGALACTSAVCLLLWTATSGGSEHRAVPPVVVAAPAPTRTGGGVTVAAPALPVSIRIPAIGVDSDLVRLGLNRDGTVAVPQDASDAGWFRLGPSPGSPGSSVILGHVDSATGPAVFYRLAQLRAGNRILVRLDDGTTVGFRVRSTTTYPNALFPAQKVYGQQGGSTLNLVTCGGEYDRARGGYQANVVVHAVRTATS